MNKNINITERLFKLSEKEYGDFIQNLTPTIKRENVIGVRTPLVKELAKELVKNDEYQDFIKELPHKYYEENMLHGLILTFIKDFDLCINLTDRFLKYIDNWAVCDSLNPNVFKKHKEELLIWIKKWIKTSDTYTVRFGVKCLMNYYLDEDFKKEYLNIPLTIKSDEYYINMMIAFYYATALAKDYEETIKIIENNELDTWIHNKTIRKAIESYRVTEEHKTYLRSLIRK